MTWVLYPCFSIKVSDHTSLYNTKNSLKWRWVSGCAHILGGYCHWMIAGKLQSDSYQDSNWSKQDFKCTWYNSSCHFPPRVDPSQCCNREATAAFWSLRPSPRHNFDICGGHFEITTDLTVAKIMEAGGWSYVFCWDCWDRCFAVDSFAWVDMQKCIFFHGTHLHTTTSRWALPTSIRGSVQLHLDLGF